MKKNLSLSKVHSSEKWHRSSCFSLLERITYFWFWMIIFSSDSPDGVWQCTSFILPVSVPLMSPSFYHLSPSLSSCTKDTHSVGSLRRCQYRSVHQVCVCLLCVIMDVSNSATCRCQCRGFVTLMYVNIHEIVCTHTLPIAHIALVVVWQTLSHFLHIKIYSESWNTEIVQCCYINILNCYIGLHPPLSVFCFALWIPHRIYRFKFLTFLEMIFGIQNKWWRKTEQKGEQWR